MRGAVRVLLLALLGAAPLSAQAAPEVRKIEFEGAKSFREEFLRAAIISNQTRCSLHVIVCWLGKDRQYVDEVGLRGDLVRLRLFYYQRGFRDARIQLDTLREDDGIEIRFRITEGVPVRVRSVELTGMEGLHDDLPIAVGQPFSLIDYEAARDTLHARLANLGYARAEVLANYTIPRDSQYVAHVQFEVVPGDRLRFGEISVQGVESITPRVVRRMLTFGRGDYYSVEDLLRSQRNLFGLEAFRHVEIRADVKSTTDTIVPVTVQVNEGNLHRVRFGLGLSNAEFVNAEGLWTSRNFLGGARRLEIRGRLYNVLAQPLHYVPLFEDTEAPYNKLSGSISADFTQPWFFDPSHTLNAGVYAERRSLPDIFVRSARGGYISFTRTLGSNSTFSLAYRPELTSLSAGGDLVFCVNFVACGPDEIQVLRDPHWLAPVAVGFARDRSNSLFAPTAGYIIRFDAEYAGGAVGSDFGYSRIIAEFSTYKEVTSGVVLATRVRPGWARALGDGSTSLGLHPQKRFFGGGANSVRGFAQFRMGPKLLTVNAAATLADSTQADCTPQQINGGACDVSTLARDDEGAFDVRPVGGAAIMEGNFELRVPFVGEKLRAAVFMDFGQVWKQSRDFTLSDVVLTPGFGFRYFSAIGPVRVDVGYNPQKGERLSVLTTKVCAVIVTGGCEPIEDGMDYSNTKLQNTNELVSLGDVEWNANPKWWQRFQLHFSIGQAF